MVAVSEIVAELVHVGVPVEESVDVGVELVVSEILGDKKILVQELIGIRSQEKFEARCIYF